MSTKQHPADVLATATDNIRLYEWRQGICLGLQVLSSFGHDTAWRELVVSAGCGEMVRHAALVEPDEWKLSGFSRLAWSELRMRKPKK